MSRVRLAVALLAAGAALLAGCAKPSAPATPQADFSDLGLAPTATTGIIRGVVVDEAIRPLPNATVALSPGNLTTHTSASGTFGFDKLAAGTYFLHVSRLGYAASQASVDVVAGVAEPPAAKVQLVRLPGTTPYVEASTHVVYMTCGFAVFATSAGCDTSTADRFGDTVYFLVNFTQLPTWTQGELVWDQTQPLGGGFIWQIAKPGSNDYYSGGQTGSSPLLAFIDTANITANAKDILSIGAEYRVFGGPSPSCTVDTPYTPYGCGVTFEQKATAYLHSFYNFAPPEGWRFTKDGDPVVPQ